MKTLFITTLTTLLLISCGGDSDTGTTSQATTTCDINKVWAKTDSLPFGEIDLRNAQLGSTSAASVDVNTGSGVFTCSANYLVSGDGCSGSYIASNATLTSGSGDCSILNNSGTYTNNGTTLTLCDGSPPCFNYGAQ